MKKNPRARKLRFLLVEDDASAAMICNFALQEGWSKQGVEAEVKICKDGLEAVQYLNAAMCLPDLILADVNMPLLDGLRMLTILKDDTRFRAIPIVMLTTSDDPKDVERAFQGQCAGYLIKDADFEKFAATLESLQVYWQNSRLPEH